MYANFHSTGISRLTCLLLQWLLPTLRSTIHYLNCQIKDKKASERGAANEQWLFQCDDRRRRTIKTALYRRIEDKRRHHKDK
ncbi:hypothetical protein T02_3637, partial [Trichinella nativa]